MVLFLFLLLFIDSDADADADANTAYAADSVVGDARCALAIDAPTVPHVCRCLVRGLSFGAHHLRAMPGSYVQTFT